MDLQLGPYSPVQSKYPFPAPSNIFADMYRFNPFSKDISEMDVCRIDCWLWLYERILYFH